MTPTTRKYERKAGANPPGRPRLEGGGAACRVNLWVTDEMREQDEKMMKELGITTKAELYRIYREMFYRYRRECT